MTRACERSRSGHPIVIAIVSMGALLALKPIAGESVGGQGVVNGGVGEVALVRGR